MVDLSTPTGVRDVKISTFLWSLQEGPESLSNDRNARFKENSNFQEWIPSPFPEDFTALKRQEVTLGDVVVVTDETKNVLVGTVAKFRKKASGKKSERLFKHSTLYFIENPEVEFLLFPICKFESKTSLVPVIRGSLAYFGHLNYECSVNPTLINFIEGTIQERLLQVLFE